MAIDSIKSSMQFQDVQKTNLKATDNTSGPAPAEKVTPSASTKLSDSLANMNEANEEEYAQSTDEQRIKSAVKHANTQMKHAKTRCEFSYHEPTKRVSIKVIDKDTQEVIREIPPEETLEMVEKMWELAGILVDERR